MNILLLLSFVVLLILVITYSIIYYKYRKLYEMHYTTQDVQSSREAIEQLRKMYFFQLSRFKIGIYFVLILNIGLGMFSLLQQSKDISKSKDLMATLEANAVPVREREPQGVQKDQDKDKATETTSFAEEESIDDIVEEKVPAKERSLVAYDPNEWNIKDFPWQEIIEANINENPPLKVEYEATLTQKLMPYLGPLAITITQNKTEPSLIISAVSIGLDEATLPMALDNLDKLMNELSEVPSISMFDITFSYSDGDSMKKETRWFYREQERLVPVVSE